MAASTRAFLRFDADRDVARARCAARASQPMPLQIRAPMRSMIVEPRDAERQRHARHPGGEQEQRGAEKFEAGGEPAADELADDAARGLRAARPRSSAASRARSSRTSMQREAADAHRGVGARAALLVVALPEHHEARDAEHDRE